MTKIAVVDLLFNWPPDGGARVDVKEVLTRLSKYHQVTLFVPDFPKGFPRGKIQGNFPFDIKKINFNIATFNFIEVTRKIKREITLYSPDFLLITDDWFLKPYIVNALKEFNPILRIYAYENLCLLSYGIKFIDGKSCDFWYLKNPFKCTMCAMKWLLKTRARYLSFLHLTSLSFSPTYYMAVKNSLSNASKIIVYNKKIKEFIDEYNQNCIIIPSGVDTSFFIPSDNHAKGGKKPVYFFSPGRLNNPIKGASFLLQACDRLWEKRKDFKLLLTTDAVSNRDYIITANWENHDSLPAIYNNSDICIVPSLWEEPFGIVAVEAMSCGKPVIASGVGGLKDIVEDGKTGFTVLPGDINALAEKIELLMNNPELRVQMGKEGRKKAQEKYCWDVIVEKYYKPLFESKP
ncbi:MAG: hypothetical protein A2042_07605 [Candidatus Schekmanbacteria bacterium GWA2_38_11]|uniref:Glycosyl transferase family 1 domain-containing protein n=1 Tax=Candidatus Schekmanbacteria bacterium GWA2_38_11 TaxID=1817876 RepID=A0A1F7RDI0_9BACT|nr:MAG: hypothetical protein A2042_07605 [Candidatus Schekmanbacteria bacterium GWA2_38_11]